MDFKRTRIEGKLLEVVSYENYVNNPDMYMNTSTAVETEMNGEKYILPYRNMTDDRPGIYNAGCINIVRTPAKEDKEYSPENIIDLGKVDNMADMIKAQSKLRDMETEILTSPDNIYTPRIEEADSPEMVALKEAVIEKHMDINKYAARFGDNFPNDKRLFKQHSISLGKLVKISNALDMEVELIIRDKNENVPNPIGKEVHAILTGLGGNADD